MAAAIFQAASHVKTGLEGNRPVRRYRPMHQAADVICRAGEVFQRAGLDAHFLADGPVELGRAGGAVEHIVQLLGGQGNGFAFRADKARHAAGVAHHVPAFVGDDHAHQHITGKGFMLGGDPLAIPDFHNLFGGNDHLLDEVLHAVIFHRFFQVVLDLVFIAGIGMHHIPFQGARSVFCHFGLSYLLSDALIK